MNPALARKLFFQAQSARLSRCFAPGMSCQNPGIKAHSIQNSRVLDLLEVGGHVFVPSIKLDKANNSAMYWDRVGRNLATTFEGLCSTHDMAIFLPIDTRLFSSNDSEQLFLFAYRAVIQELHASMQAAQVMQTGYVARVQEGLDGGNEPNAAGMAAVVQMTNAHSTFLYKSRLDAALKEESWNFMEHRVVIFNDQAPAFAASVLFDLDNRPLDDESPRVAMTVFPISLIQTVLLASYTPEDRVAVVEYLNPFLEADGFYQKYLLSRTLLMHAQNFVVSPVVFNAWSESKKQAILDFLFETVRFNTYRENEDLYLF